MTNPVTNRAGFMIYPRGFLGAIQAPRIRKEVKSFDAEVNRLQTDLNYGLKQNNNTNININDDVEMLYSAYIKRNRGTESWDFMRQVYITALSAFGTTRFDDWYFKQFDSPSVGDLHREFLDDTLTFIQTGRRDQPLQTWMALLDYTDSGELNRVITLQGAEFFGITSDGYRRERRDRFLIDTIQLWASQPMGTEDLLVTLHILFGDLQ